MISSIWLGIISVEAIVIVAYLALVYWGYRKKPTWLKDPNFKPLVSLIIPTYNEQSIIGRKLENTIALDYPKEKLEIFVVDSASTDNTRQIVEELIQEKGSAMNISFISEQERKGKVMALNSVLPLCRGELIAVSDADALLEKNSLGELVSCFADATVGAATGVKQIYTQGSSRVLNDEKAYMRIFNVFRLGESKLHSTYNFQGELAVFRRDALKWFNTGCDDSGTAMDVIKKGFRAVYDEEAIIYDNAPSDVKSQFKQKSRRGRSIIEVMLDNIHALVSSRVDYRFKVIYLFNLFLHVVSPVLVLILMVLTPFVIVEYPVLLILGLIYLSLFFFPGCRFLANAIDSFVELQLILLNSMRYHLQGERFIIWEQARQA